MTTTDTVDGCEACPYSYPRWVNNNLVCSHDDAPAGKVLCKATEAPPPAPPWCPLRSGPTLVVLEL